MTLNPGRRAEMAKSMTLDEFFAKRTSQWYTIPELAYRWKVHPREVCQRLTEYNVTPEKFTCGSWTYWQVDGLSVDNIEKKQRMLFS